MYPPRALIWAPIPCLSTLCPIIGHFGITDSSGVIYDFGGDFYVNSSETHTTFGPPTLYRQIPEGGKQAVTDEEWDTAISLAAEQYRQKRYSFFCNNCHHFVATALKIMYPDRRKYGVLSIIRHFRLGRAVRKVEAAHSQ